MQRILPVILRVSAEADRIQLRLWIRVLASLLERSQPSGLPSTPVVGHHNERRRECETGQHRPTVVRSSYAESTARTKKLTVGRSIQDALRMYLQPIKNDDPKLDFYTMYKRETMEYDTEYMQKYNEDLNTTLIFVRALLLSLSYLC